MKFEIMEGEESVVKELKDLIIKCDEIWFNEFLGRSSEFPSRTWSYRNGRLRTFSLRVMLRVPFFRSWSRTFDLISFELDRLLGR